MGVWDALGRGISGGVEAYLTGKRRQEEEKRRGAAETLGKERLALAQFQARTGLEQYEDQQALAGQLRAEERHKELDPRSTEPGIHIPMFADWGQGVRIPLAQAERDQMYVEQKNAFQAQQAELADEELRRDKDLAEYRARMQHKYSYPPSHIPPADRPEGAFFINGVVNPPEAFRALQSFIQTYAGGNALGFWSNPDLQERFLDDVALRYSAAVPGAKELAQVWMLQQTLDTTDGGEEAGPGFFRRLGPFIKERVGPFLEGMPYGGPESPPWTPPPAMPPPISRPKEPTVRRGRSTF